VAKARDESDRTLAEIFTGTPAMRDRYVAMGPLGELARAGDADAAGRITATLEHDADWPVRARAAEVATGVAAAQTALLAASHDPEPRVREAAMVSMATALVPGAIDAAKSALAGDGWSFVKVPALAVLGHAQPSPEVDAALAGTLKDASPRVRGAALVAIGRRRVATLHQQVRERLDDPGEDPDVRAAAARVLGALCDATSADRLTEYARKLGVAGSGEDEQAVALAALEGLAAMQPPDLAARIAPLRAETSPPSVSNAADRALKAHGVCR
jgi:HEAT repeat protein